MMASIHETAEGLHAAGVMDTQTMRRFEELCLTPVRVAEEYGAMNTTDLAESVLGVLRVHEAELRREGIRHRSLFGSVARGAPCADSDVDLAADFDPDAHMDLFRLNALERRISDIPGRRVDLLGEAHFMAFHAINP